MHVATVSLAATLAPEDQARADCYALLANLFADGPAAGLLQALAGSERLPEDDNQPLAVAYNRLLDASAAMDAEAARQEHDDLFVGVGKSQVDPHALHWQAGPGHEHSLALLRADLARLGLGRLPQCSLYEDHVAVLCEAMRLLVAGQQERPPATIAEQREFFERHLAQWIDAFCDAIERCPIANYYRRVSEFTRIYMAVERDSLAID